VPAFSVGRTQEVVYDLVKLFQKNSIPNIPIYVDSPLSIKATGIFKIHPECYDKEMANLISNGVDIFDNGHIHYVNDAEESKKLNFLNEPCMIISASGMCESGRILHHLANNIENISNTILIIGFMAEHTLGRRLIEQKDQVNGIVKIYGEEYKVRAKIKILNSFSAHADKSELRTYLNKFDRTKLKKLFIVHGEPDQQKILREDLSKTGISKIEIPARGQEYEI
jgi:metallo-beta-lactamase family protein